MIRFAGRLLLFLGAAALGGVGGALRFAASDVPWPTFSAALTDVAKLAALGTGLRIALQDLAGRVNGHWRVGMFIANVLGTAALAYALEHPSTPQFSWAFMVGFCGGLTTFSGFVNESLALVQQRRRVGAALFVGLTLAVSMIAFHLQHASGHVSFPWRTMVVNLSGCFLFGFLDRACDPFAARNALHRLLLSGLLGGYTTLSALVAETLSLAVEQPTAAAANVVAQLVVGAWLITAGQALGSRLTGRRRASAAR